MRIAEFIRCRTRQARSLGFALGIGAGLLALSGRAQAQDQYLDAINKRVKEVVEEFRSDKILIPVFAKMQTPPPEVLAPLAAGPAWELIDPSSPRWAAAKAWAEAGPQVDALKALAAATDKDKPRMAFALRYGAADSRDAVMVGMNVELGEEATIAAAQGLYLPRVQWLQMLANVEATRLLAEGKPGEAMGVMVNLVYFGRQLCDRELVTEVRLGYRLMTNSLERIRDIAFTDFMGERKLQPDEIRVVIDRVQEAKGGGVGLYLSRLRFPEGDRLGIEQIISRAYGTAEMAEPGRVGPMMARIAAKDHPLMIFNEAARWSAAATGLSTKSAAAKTLRDVYGDWTGRWSVDFFSPQMKRVYEFDQLPKGSNPIIGLLGDMKDVYERRQLVHVEAVGTRTSLGLLGYFYTNKAFARVVTSASPAWLEKEGDPYNAEGRDRGGFQPIEYFRPVVDTNGRPHDMTVVPGTGENFLAPLKDDVWVLYSVGSDNQANFAKIVQNTSTKVTNADYIIWPPMASLIRKNLKDTGRLK